MRAFVICDLWFDAKERLSKWIFLTVYFGDFQNRTSGAVGLNNWTAIVKGSFFHQKFLLFLSKNESLYLRYNAILTRTNPALRTYKHLSFLVPTTNHKHTNQNAVN